MKLFLKHLLVDDEREGRVGKKKRPQKTKPNSHNIDIYSKHLKTPPGVAFSVDSIYLCENGQDHVKLEYICLKRSP